MTFSDNRNLFRWLIVVASFIIISLILWNTYVFFQKFKAEERTKMENWAFAQTELIKIISEASLDNNITTDTELILKVLNSNTTTPMLVVTQDTIISSYSNIGENTPEDSLYVTQNIDKLINQFRSENEPFKIYYDGKEYSTLYYGNSPLLNKLKYYPIALLLIILLFGAVVFFFYRSSKIATQNKLWSGMAKETAHQIGTPLSSLIGWAEILKNENVKAEYINEIEKDIDRLQTITERFSKIGSIPKLERKDIVEETIKSYDYLKARSSKLVTFNLEVPEQHVFVKLNTQLYSWTIENLVKNAIDAMKGKGELFIKIVPSDKEVRINVTDTGKGLVKAQFNKIFETGYTTKQRGWGLGLSLAKRIIEDYHKGKIKVLNSQVNKGTTMQISLKLD